MFEPLSAYRAQVSFCFSSSSAFLVIISIIAFSLSIVIAPYHINGDQEHYTKAYYLMNDLGLTEAWGIYTQSIFSYEPVHFFVSWILVNLGFDKVIAMAALNSLMAALFGRFLLERTNNFFVVFLLVFSNQYLYAFFFTLEKLKIAIIFLLLFLNYRLRFFGVLAALAHLQIALLFAVYVFAFILSQMQVYSFFKLFKFRNLKQLVLLVVILMSLSMLFGDYALQKFFFYMAREGGGSVTLIYLIAIFFATLFSTNYDWKIITWYFLLVATLSFILGGDRINMFAFMGFVYFTSYLKSNSLKKFIFLNSVLFSSLYFGYSSYQYLNMVIVDGG